MFLALLATVLIGCATTGSNRSSQSSGQTFSELVESLPSPMPGKVRVVAYRKTTAAGGLFLDAVIKKDGTTIFTLGNGDFAFEQLPIGLHELVISYPGNLYNYYCRKSFIFFPDQIVFLKAADRDVNKLLEVSPFLGLLAIIPGHLKESEIQKAENCAGWVEIHDVDKLTAISDNGGQSRQPLD